MPNRDKPLILCIEDDEDVRTLLAMQLENICELIFAEDGEEGVRLALFHQPDLILMDLLMPNMDGLEAAEMIRSVKGVRCPVVALPAAPKSIRERAQAAGCDLVIEKPALDLAARLAPLLAQGGDSAPR